MCSSAHRIIWLTVQMLNVSWGVQVPAVSYAIFKHNLNVTSNTKINLKGLAVGNGLTDPAIQYGRPLGGIRILLPLPFAPCFGPTFSGLIQARSNMMMPSCPVTISFMQPCWVPRKDSSAFGSNRSPWIVEVHLLLTQTRLTGLAKTCLMQTGPSTARLSHRAIIGHLVLCHDHWHSMHCRTAASPDTQQPCAGAYADYALHNGLIGSAARNGIKAVSYIRSLYWLQSEAGYTCFPEDMAWPAVLISVSN